MNFRLRREKTQENEEPEQPDRSEIQAQLLREEQERLAGVDTAISEGIAAVRAGREAVTRRLHGGDGRTTPLEILQSGRRQVLDLIGKDVRDTSMAPMNALHELNADLADSLAGMAERVPEDPIMKRAFEAEVRATVTSYMNSVHNILRPNTFTR